MARFHKLVIDILDFVLSPSLAYEREGEESAYTCKNAAFVGVHFSVCRKGSIMPDGSFSDREAAKDWPLFYF